MSSIDNTTYFHLLQSLSGKKPVDIIRDLCIYDHNTSRRFQNGDDIKGTNKKKSFWPKQKLWRKEDNEANAESKDSIFKLLDANKERLKEQPFPDFDRKNELSFPSHATYILLSYMEKSSSSSSKNLSATQEKAKQKVCSALEEFEIPEHLIDEVREKDSLYEIARFIVGQASTADNEETQLSILSRRVDIKSFSDLKEMGLTALDVAKNLVDNDYALFPNISTAHEGSSPAYWAQFIEEYGDSYFQFLVPRKGKKIVGNWSILPISSEEQRQQILAGTFKEASFDLAQTPFLFMPGDYFLYVLNLSVNRAQRSEENFRMLSDSLFERLFSYAQTGIFFKGIYTCAHSKFEESLWRQFGFEHFNSNEHGGEVFELLGTQLPADIHPELRKLYDDHFKLVPNLGDLLQSASDITLDFDVFTRKADRVLEKIALAKEKGIETFSDDEKARYYSSVLVFDEIEDIKAKLNRITEILTGKETQGHSNSLYVSPDSFSVAREYIKEVSDWLYTASALVDELDGHPFPL